MIVASRVSYAYGATPALVDVDLATAPGRVLGLIGPNGSGKTTLLRCLFGSLVPQTGAVELDGRPLSSHRGTELARRLAVVIQEPTSELPMSATDMVLLGRSPHRNTFERYRAEDRAIAASSLRRVGAGHLAARDVGALSGGERQRVLIARALAQQAEHLLLDEPTNHLDVRYQHELLQRVRALGGSTVVVLHDLNLAARYCDDALLLDGGHTVAYGPVGDVLTPEILEPVYGIGITRIELGGHIHLLFSPGGGDAVDSGLECDVISAPPTL